MTIIFKNQFSKTLYLIEYRDSLWFLKIISDNAVIKWKCSILKYSESDDCTVLLHTERFSDPLNVGTYVTTLLFATMNHKFNLANGYENREFLHSTQTYGDIQIH